MDPAPSTQLVALDVSIALALAISFPIARNRAGARLGESDAVRRRATTAAVIGSAAWIAITGALAASGVLERWDRTPPPMLVLLAVSVAATLALALSRIGRALALGLPLAVLVGYQAFRVAVEVMLHRAYEQGLIGAQMTWSGRNFDVASGASALALGVWLALRGDRAVPRAVVWAWNLLGLALLANIVVVAVLSMPTPLRAFDGPANAFVATFPFVWLPTVMVTGALFGHVLVARRLTADRRGRG